VIGGLGAFSLTAARAAVAAEPLPPTLRERVLQLMADCDVPGLGFGLIRDGAVASVEAFGYADREKKVSVTTDTAFLISSISKTVTGTALMQSWEGGLFQLDDPI
jgi:CubicO group peptidase (beta-lactamase class C family)